MMIEDESNAPPSVSPNSRADIAEAARVARDWIAHVGHPALEYCLLIDESDRAILCFRKELAARYEREHRLDLAEALRGGAIGDLLVLELRGERDFRISYANEYVFMDPPPASSSRARSIRATT